MGIKLATNKDSWTDANKIISAWLYQAPYWSGTSKELVTTDANTTIKNNPSDMGIKLVTNKDS